MKKVNGRTEVILYTNTVQLLPETECVCVCVGEGGSLLEIILTDRIKNELELQKKVCQIKVHLC